MKRNLSIILNTGLLFLSFNGISQNLVTHKWNENCGSQNCIKPPKITCDANQNSILTGINHSAVEGKNITTSKINTNGNLIWEKEYHVGSNDVGVKSVIDQNNNIYTLGKIETNSGFKSVILKYSSNGVLLWDYILTSGNYNNPKDIVLGVNGEIYFSAEYNNGASSKVFIGQLSNSGVLQNQYTYVAGINYLVSLDQQNGKILIGSNTNGINNSYITQLNSSLSEEWRINVDNELVSAKYDSNGSILYITKDNALNQKGHLNKIQNNTTNVWDIDLGFDCDFNSCESIKIENNTIYILSSHNNGSEIALKKINSSGDIEWSKPYYGGVSHYTNPCFKVVNNTVICSANEIHGAIHNVVTYKIGETGTLLWQSKKYNNYVGGVDANQNGDVFIATQKNNNALLENDLTKLSQYSANDVADVSDIPSGNLAYFQYVGQIKNMDGIGIKELTYYGFNNDNGYYLFENKVSFTHFSGDQDSTTLDTLTRWDFKFNGANVVQPTGFNAVDYYNNYYYTNLKRERVNGYKKVVYPDLYTNIDLEIGENRHGTVMFYVIKPTGDVSTINLLKDGGISSIDNNGDLHTVIGGYEQIFEKPIYYEIDTLLNDTIYTNCDYVLTGNNLTFSTANPINSSNRIKVIQMKEKGPDLQTKSPDDNFNWCSYIRNPGVQSFNGAISKIDHDDNNNTYYAGNVHTNSVDGTFPTNAGTFPMPIGLSDITIMKLTDDIEIKWATYFGGTGGDAARSISVEPSGSAVFVVGTSHSTDFPASTTFTGSYQSVDAGSAFIVELNGNGQTLWATKFELSGEGNIGFRDCEVINGSLYAVGDRENLSPSSLPFDGQSYYSTDGVGFIGIFKAGGVYLHGTGFGGPLSSNSHTKIYGIDYNGINAIAITGSTTDPNLPIQNAPSGYGSYISNSPGHTNAFIAKIGLNGNLDFSYYISSLANTAFGVNQLSDQNAYYEALGDRGNDIKFSPDGTSIYLVGELFGDSFTHHPSSNPLAYSQSTRSIVNLNFGQISGAGFIFKTDLNGGIKSANYFSPSAQDNTYLTSMRLQQISFDSNGNMYVTGHQGKTSCDPSQTANEYNIPIPSTQPVNFYQKNKTTYSNLNGSFGINSNSFIVAFNSDDTHIWSTYISGYRQSAIKPIDITNNNHLYFAGSSDVINQIVDDEPDFQAATNAEKDVIKLPYWEYDPIPGNNLDWFNGQGAGNTCEFAGRFDVSGVNDAGPVLGLDDNDNFEFTVYPNPNHSNILYIDAESVNKIEVFGLDGKLVVSLTQNNISSIDISQLAKGVYVIKGYTNTEIYSTKFIKQ